LYLAYIYFSKTKIMPSSSFLSSPSQPLHLVQVPGVIFMGTGLSYQKLGVKVKIQS